jgi:hypothetical protein
MDVEMNKLENKICFFEREMAIILASLAYHISPEIVKYIVEQNKEDFPFFSKIFSQKIEIKNYLYDGSDCVFRG